MENKFKITKSFKEKRIKYCYTKKRPYYLKNYKDINHKFSKNRKLYSVKKITKVSNKWKPYSSKKSIGGSFLTPAPACAITSSMPDIIPDKHLWLMYKNVGQFVKKDWKETVNFYIEEIGKIMISFDGSTKGSRDYIAQEKLYSYSDDQINLVINYLFDATINTNKYGNFFEVPKYYKCSNPDFTHGGQFLFYNQRKLNNLLKFLNNYHVPTSVTMNSGVGSPSGDLLTQREMTGAPAVSQNQEKWTLEKLLSLPCNWIEEQDKNNYNIVKILFGSIDICGWKSANGDEPISYESIDDNLKDAYKSFIKKEFMYYFTNKISTNQNMKFVFDNCRRQLTVMLPELSPN